MFSTDLRATGNTTFCKAAMEDNHYSMAPGGAGVQHAEPSVKLPKLHLQKHEFICRVPPNQLFSAFKRTHGNRSASKVKNKIQRQWSIHMCYMCIVLHGFQGSRTTTTPHSGTIPMYRPKVKPHRVKWQNQVTVKKKLRKNTVFSSLVSWPKETEFWVWETLRTKKLFWVIKA